MMTVCKGSTVTHEGDRELAQAAANGDALASRELVLRLLPRVRGGVRRIVRDHRDFDDLVQMSMMQVLRSLERFRGESSLEGWSHKIVIRTVLREMKSIRIEIPVEDPEEIGESDLRIEEGIDRARFKRLVRSKVNKLRPKKREVLVLSEFHGLSVADIAEVLDLPVNTVRERLRDARRRLRASLSKDQAIRAWIEGEEG